MGVLHLRHAGTRCMVQSVPGPWPHLPGQTGTFIYNTERAVLAVGCSGRRHTNPCTVRSAGHTLLPSPYLKGKLNSSVTAGKLNLFTPSFSICVVGRTLITASRSCEHSEKGCTLYFSQGRLGKWCKHHRVLVSAEQETWENGEKKN